MWLAWESSDKNVNMFYQLLQQSFFYNQFQKKVVTFTIVVQVDMNWVTPVMKFGTDKNVTSENTWLYASLIIWPKGTIGKYLTWDSAARMLHNRTRTVYHSWLLNWEFSD